MVVNGFIAPTRDSRVTRYALESHELRFSLQQHKVTNYEEYGDQQVDERGLYTIHIHMP